MSEPKLYKKLIVWCPNPIVWLSEFVQTQYDLKIQTTPIRMLKPEPNPNLNWT